MRGMPGLRVLWCAGLICLMLLGPIAPVSAQGVPGGVGAAGEAAPSLLRLEVLSAQVLRVTWAPPVGWSPAGYRLWWRPRGADTFATAGVDAATFSHDISGLRAGESYIVRLAALSEDGALSETARASATMPLAAPGALALQALSAQALRVTWAAPAGWTAAGYRLWWRPLGAEVFTTADVDAATFSYEISGLNLGGSYIVRLAALNDDGAWSDLARRSVVMPLVAPGALALQALSAQALRVTWAAPAGWTPAEYRLWWRPRGSSVFLGSVDVAASVSTYDVSGLDAGSDYVVRVTALTSNGSGSSPATGRATTLAALEIEVSAPSHCLTGEGQVVHIGNDGSTVGRAGVADVEVSYTISGGSEPYAVTSPDTADTTSTPTGSVTVSCARPGVDLNNVAADANVVESGPKTITLTATDNTGATAEGSTVVIVAEDAYTTEHNNGLMTAGGTYVLGTPDEWTLITLPAALDLRFEGLSDNDGEFVAHFADTHTGSEIWLNWTTGAELYRRVLTVDVAAGSSAAPRAVGGLFDALVASVHKPAGAVYAPTTRSGGASWRPYAGLPDDTQVGVHPLMLEGKPIFFCNAAMADDFANTVYPGDSTKTKDDFQRIFDEAFDSAIESWNDAVGQVGTTGIPDDVFKKSCAGEKKSIVVQKVEMGHNGCNASGGCAYRYITGDDPPTINLEMTLYIYITINNAHVFESVIAHEMGHFFGLGDYKDHTIDYSSDCPAGEMTLYTADTEICHSETITTRDKSDVHAIYHPDARPGIRLRSGGVPPQVQWILEMGDPPTDTEGNNEHNAYKYVILYRDAGSDDRPLLLRSLESIKVIDFSLPTSLDPTGVEFIAVGVTRGDPQRDTSPSEGIEHSVVTLTGLGSEIDGEREETSWTLGAPVRVYGPPNTPKIVSARSGPGRVALRWKAVPGATGYLIYNALEEFGESNLPARPQRVSGAATEAPVLGLVNGATYHFRIRALIGDFSSQLSEPTTATPVQVPEAPSAVTVSATSDSVTLRWGDVAGATAYEVRRVGRAVIRTSATSYTFGRLAASTTYLFEVRAVNIAGASAWARVTARTLAPPVQVPEAPSAVTVSATSDSVTLRWGDVAGATAYEVRRVGRAVIRTSATSYTFGRLAASTTYLFEVRAVNIAGASAWARVTARTLAPPVQVPEAPSAVTVSATSDSVTLRWGDVAGATAYEVRRVGRAVIRTSATSYTFGRLAASTTYLFEVRAVNIAGASAWARVTARTLAAPLPDKVQISGRVSILRMAPTPVGGHTLSLSFTPSGGSRILPRLRFLPFSDLETVWLYTSAVSGPTSVGTRELGRIAARKTGANSERIEVAFRPAGSRSVVLPTPARFVTYSNMVLGTWYTSSTFTFTIAATARGQTDDAPFEGRLAHALAPGEEVCDACFEQETDLEASPVPAQTPSEGRT